MCMDQVGSVCIRFEDEEGTIEVNMSMVPFSSSQLFSEHESGRHVGGD